MLNKSILSKFKSSKNLFTNSSFFKTSSCNFQYKYCGVAPYIACAFSKNVKNNNKGKTKTQYTGSKISEMSMEDYDTFLKNKEAGIYKAENADSLQKDIQVINPKDLEIPEYAQEVTYVKSQGAGGQHVNKTNSKAVIKFKLDSANFMTKEAKKKFITKYPNLLNKSNEAIVTSQDTRESNRNYLQALGKLKEYIADAMTEDRERVVKFTEEDPDLKQRRMDSKKKRSDIKKQRQNSRDF